MMAAPNVRIDTRSVLFTDLVSSTELRVRLGEVGADELRRVHDQVLTDAVTWHHGTVVKGLGDGLMVTFASAVDAVHGAVAIQQAAENHARQVPTQAFEVRVGISLGDVSTEEGDAFGVPVVEAARLCGVAAAGEILATDVVRSLARGRCTATFEPMGELTLKGLPDPVVSCRVVWAPVMAPPLDAVDHGVPVPSALLGAVTDYVGRPELLGQLAAVRAAVVSGAARTVLLAGEPGVGKTRTAAEVARRAFADGAVVLYGRCDEDLAVPYQPFVEALDHYARHAVEAALGRLPGELRRLCPALGELIDELPSPVTSDPASEEHRLFEAIASWLVAVAAAVPAGLVLVVDDIHWATKPTLQLFQHVVRAAGGTGVPLLVLGTYRDTDIDRAHPLSAALADLRRVDGTERISVANLNEHEVIGFIESAAGHVLDDDALRLAAVVHEETEGNPFFVGEIMRHLIETAGVRREGDRWVVTEPGRVAVPEGVRDVVGRRLTRLSDAANEVLSTAAVYGRDFEVDPLLAMVGCGEDEALDALDDAVRARLIEEVSVDRYRFSHALVRTTLYEELSATRQRRLHRRVADVLEKLRPHDVTALAHHCTQAGPDGGDVGRAVRYTLAAADASLAARAFAEAELQFLNALELVGEEPPDTGTERLVVGTLCGLGEAQRDQGNPAYRETLLEASRRALVLNDVALIERSVVANSRGFASGISLLDEERIAILEQAREMVAGVGPASRSRITAQLAAELTYGPDHRRRHELVDEAVNLARSTNDTSLLAFVLVLTGYAGLSTRRRELAYERAVEAAGLSDVAGDPTLRVLAMVFLSGAQLAAGEVRASADTLEAAVVVAEQHAAPTVQWYARCLRIRAVQLAGALDEAELATDRELATSQELGQSDGVQFWLSATAATVWLRGHAGTLADAAGESADNLPLSATWRMGHAWFLAVAGREAEAQAILATHAFDPVALLDEPWWFAPVTHAAFCAWHVGDAVLAARAIEALEVPSGGWTHFQTGCNGPVAWPRGLALATCGDHDGAIVDLEAALADVIVQNCPSYVPHIRRDLALVHRARGGPGDTEIADELLAVALAEATAGQLTGVVEEVTQLLERAR